MLNSPKFWTIIAILAIFTGGGLFGAEASLPGDYLYAVKVDFNEPIITAVQITDRRIANWRSEQVEKRMLEVERLILRDDINHNNLDDRIQTIEKYHQKARRAIDKVLSKEHYEDAISIANRFESVSMAHRQVSATLVAQYIPVDDEEKQKIYVSLLDGIDKQTNLASATRSNIEAAVLTEDRLGLRGFAESQLARARDQLRTSRSLIETNRRVVGINVVDQAEKYMQLGNNELPIGKNHLDAGNFQIAFGHFSQSLRYALEAEITINVAVQIDKLEN